MAEFSSKPFVKYQFSLRAKQYARLANKRQILRKLKDLVVFIVNIIRTISV